MTSQPDPHALELAEQVARVIDPEAWEEYLLEDGRVDPEVASIFEDAYRVSIAKAAAVLALLDRHQSEALKAAREALSVFAHVAESLDEMGEEDVLRLVYDDPEWGDNTVISEIFVRPYFRAREALARLEGAASDEGEKTDGR